MSTTIIRYDRGEVDMDLRVYVKGEEYRYPVSVCGVGWVHGPSRGLQ